MSVNSIINKINKINNINRNRTNINNKVVNKINNVVNKINKNAKTTIPEIRNLSPKDLMAPIGILDPNGKANNPLTGEPYKNIYRDPNKNIGRENPTYASLGKVWSGFPMYAKKEEAIRAIHDNQVTLVISGTGSGKTVLTPKFALHALNYQGRIVVTTPKKLTTKGAAEFAAKTLDVKVGKEIGIKYKGSDKSWYSKTESKITYCTDGYILARLMSEPLLPTFDCVIIDEAHERGVNIDLLLMLLKELIVKRPTFKLIIMSATINEQIFIDYFPKPTFTFKMVDAGEGTSYEIKEYFLDKPINRFDENGNLINNKDYIDKAVEIVVDIMKSGEEGDILVFFTGNAEIRDGCIKLHQKISAFNRNTNKKLYCQFLSAGTGKEDEKLIINRNDYKTLPNGPYTRKVVFSTNVAESSITIDGLKFVVDSGLENINIYYSKKNMEALERKYISKASHKQRKGRVGRTFPGVCYNVFTKKEYDNFRDFSVSPIILEDIGAYILRFFADDTFVSHVDLPFAYSDQQGGSIVKNNKIKATSLQNFLRRFIEPPSEEAVKRVLFRLQVLGGMEIKGNKGYINNMGRGMADFDTKLEIGRMLIAGYNYKCRDEICELAAMMNLSEFSVDKFIEMRLKKQKSWSPAKEKEEERKHKAVITKYKSMYGDHISLLKIYQSFKARRYDKIDRRTGRVIKEKLGDAREWCKKHYLNYNRLDQVKYESKEFQRRFSSAIARERNAHPNRKPDTLYLDHSPTISSKIEDNILNAILKGFFLNLLKKEGRSYSNCFPPVRTISPIDRFSLIKSPGNHLVYSQLMNIFGRASYSFICKIPTANVAEIKKQYKDLFKTCFTKSTVKKVTKKSSRPKKFKKKWKKKKF
jgi:pre-mRNA-splicing factor ATP-dependent RNA helicase DHX15/PRP43